MAAPRSLRVLTLNAHKGFALFNRRFMLPELRDAVRSVAADLVFVQEVHGAHAGHTARVAGWPQAPQYEFLADELWPQFAYGRNAVYPHGDHGNAILSKHPIARFTNHDVSIAGHEARGILHCTLTMPAGAPDVHAICVHLGLSEPHRRRQLERLCEIVRTEVPSGEPLIVAGDFNDWRVRAHRTLARCAGLSEVFVQAHGRARKTFPALLPMLQLDRIYVRGARGHAPLALPHRPWSRLSDHAPLAAEIRL